MPGGDRTGPVGLGPMTGRATGYCAGYPVSGYMKPILGRGRVAGFGCAWSRGRGWRRGWFGHGSRWRYPDGITPYYGDPAAAEFTPQQEAEMLKKEAKAMQDEINSINRRIIELESADKKTG